MCFTSAVVDTRTWSHVFKRKCNNDLPPLVSRLPRFRYKFLTRSAKEKNLVLLMDNRTDALEKSVGMLNLNKDIVSVGRSGFYSSKRRNLALLLQPVRHVHDSLEQGDLHHGAASQSRGHAQRASAPRHDTDGSRTAGAAQVIAFMPQKAHTIPFRSHTDGGFEHVFQLELPDRPNIFNRDPPISDEVWNSFRSEDGRITDVHRLKSLIFRGGVSKPLRLTAWKYMLDYYLWENTDEQNKTVRSLSRCPV